MKNSPLLAFIGGAAAGFAAAIFVAPHSGKKTRAHIKEHIKEHMRKADGKIKQMKDCIMEQKEALEQE
ncbi:MAG: YtxH domain-containing protein [Rikenellaceae bacterium]